MLSAYAAPMRLTTFWERMTEQFGPAYAESLARDLVLAQLGGRTANEALEAGDPIVEVWLAVCEAMNVPVPLRH